MVHAQDSVRERGRVKPGPAEIAPGGGRAACPPEPTGARARRFDSVPGLGVLLIALLLPMLSACDGTTTRVPAPRFAQVGELRVDVELPIADGQGTAEATLVWGSDGRWVLVERMRYLGVEGGERVVNSRRNPGELAPEYSTLNQQLNENPGLRLPGEVDQGLIPECVPPRSRVRVSMVDEYRGEVAHWTRCADGGLFSLSTASAGPDQQAARVVNAAQLARAFTLGEGERSVFEGSIPFATLDLGEDSPAKPDGPLVFLTEDGTEPEGWAGFWSRHAGGSTPPPSIDWSTQMVLVGATGLRTEAGHRLQVRRVLPVGTATRVEMIEEIPGDFCSPAARDRFPFHVVVAPLGPRPVSFSDVRQVRVACGTP